MEYSHWFEDLDESLQAELADRVVLLVDTLLPVPVGNKERFFEMVARRLTAAARMGQSQSVSASPSSVLEDQPSSMAPPLPPPPFPVVLLPVHLSHPSNPALINLNSHFRKCGPRNARADSGIYIYVYHQRLGSTFRGGMQKACCLSENGNTGILKNVFTFRLEKARKEIGRYKIVVASDEHDELARHWDLASFQVTLRSYTAARKKKPELLKLIPVDWVPSLCRGIENAVILDFQPMRDFEHVKHSVQRLSIEVTFQSPLGPRTLTSQMFKLSKGKCQGFDPQDSEILSEGWYRSVERPERLERSPFSHQRPSSRPRPTLGPSPPPGGKRPRSGPSSHDDSLSSSKPHSPKRRKLNPDCQANSAVSPPMPTQVRYIPPPQRQRVAPPMGRQIGVGPTSVGPTLPPDLAELFQLQPPDDSYFLWLESQLFA